jgi:hypothetical protein
MAANPTGSESDSRQEPGIPGAGPTMTVSTSLHAGTVEAVRSRVGRRGFSAYVEAALRRQIEQDNLAELVDEYTRTEGEFTPEELAAARADLYGSADAGTGHAA